MKIYIKYSVHKLWKRVIQDQLEKLSMSFSFADFGGLETKEALTIEQISALQTSLEPYGMEIYTDEQNLLVNRIKDVIRELIYSEGDLPSVNLSTHLSSKLNYSYAHLTAIFSEATSISIAHFVMMQKVERTKELLMETDLSLTEISYRLNYSSLAHLSNQFKQITGLSPKRFKEIIEKKRQQLESSLLGTESE